MVPLQVHAEALLPIWREAFVAPVHCRISHHCCKCAFHHGHGTCMMCEPTFHCAPYVCQPGYYVSDARCMKCGVLVTHEPDQPLFPSLRELCVCADFVIFSTPMLSNCLGSTANTMVRRTYKTHPPDKHQLTFPLVPHPTRLTPAPHLAPDLTRPTLDDRPPLRRVHPKPPCGTSSA